MNKSIRLILIILLLFVLIISGIVILNQNNSKKTEKTNIELKTQYNKENNTVNIAVISNNDNIKYSFDNGVTWQKSNTYVATKNDSYIIKIKDDKGNILSTTKYVVDVIDDIAPKLSINLPEQIYVGEKINLADYVKISNGDKLLNDIVITPSTIDTSKEGKYYITYSATDIYGNTSTKNAKIEVVDKANKSKNDNIPETIIDNTTTNNTTTNNTTTNSGTKKLYRYRTKKTISYKCNSYDCSYLDESSKKTASVKYNNPDCPDGGEIISNPCPMGSMCTQNMVNVNTSKGNICYNRNYIFGDSNQTNNMEEKKECTDGEIKVNGYCHKILAVGTYPEGCNDSSCVEFPVGPCNGDNGPKIDIPCKKGSVCLPAMTNMYKRYENYCYNISYIYTRSTSTNKYDEYGNKIVCDDDEIKINDFCHKIIEVGSYYCGANQELKDGYCYSKIKKTCYNNCEKDIWSDWSSWSTNPVTPSADIDVEVKTV